MKKFFMLFAMVLVSATMFAQQGYKAAGINLNYGMHSDVKNFGIGAKFQYGFLQNLRAEASFNYYFEKDHVTDIEIDLNAHYLLPVGGNVVVYPLAGIAWLNKSMSYGGYSKSESRIGLNLGCGIEYPIANNIKVNAEAKYELISDFNRPVFSIGAAYAF